MARVVTFSQTFSKGHPKEGQRTNFVEKIWASLVDQGIAAPEFWDGWYNLNINYDFDGNNFSNCTIEPKHHTIRAKARFKAGDRFSPRIWSGRPYASKQITIAPDIEVNRTWSLDIINDKIIIN